MWMTTVFAALVVFVTFASGEHYSHPHPHPHSHSHPHPHPHSHSHSHSPSPSHSHPHPYSHSDANRNQRIIKVQGPPHHNHHHHHGHHKHIRNGPLGPHVHYNDRDHDQHYEYVRPNHPPPIPPFFNGHNNNHVKHLPRPSPPHAHHKSPSFGNGFPHKTSSHSFRSPVIKDHFRTPTGPHRPQSVDFFPSSPVSNIHSSDDNRGPIHEIPAPNLGPKPSGNPYKSPDFIHGKGPSIEIPKTIKETPSPIVHGPGYEVTENNHSSNDHVIESHDGIKSFYAPDPDPSLPVYKVPPTKDPYSIPSHGKKVLEEYAPHLSQDFQILDGGSVSAPVASLSPQELFSLMHGHGHALQQPIGHQQPVIALLGQPQQPSNLILPPEAGHGHYQHQSTNDVERYLQQQPHHAGNDVSQFLQQPHHAGNDVSQFLQHPEIHNTLHASQQQGIVHMAMIDHINAQQSVYPQNNQYQIQLPAFNNPQYQSFNYDEKDPNAGAIPMESHQNPQISDNYPYEPEASETRNSMSVIRQQADNNDSIQKLLLNDLANNVVDNQIEDSDVRQPEQAVFDVNRPEVPFYTTLPSRQAAEALATLQAAGSIASQLQNIRVQNPENEESEQEEKSNGPLGLQEEQLSKPQKIHYFPEPEEQTEIPNTERSTKEEKNVEVQKSIPVYEASYISSGLADPQNEQEKSPALETEDRQEEVSDQLDFRQDDGGQKFGRRIRPK